MQFPTQVNPASMPAARRSLAAAVIAPVLALIGTGTAAWGAPTVVVPGTVTGVNNVTSLTATTTLVGLTSSTSVTGVGQAYNVYTPSNTYTVNYAGLDQAVQTITAGGTTYAATGIAQDVIERFVGPKTDTLWYVGTGTGTTNGSTLNLKAPSVTGYTQGLAGNNLLLGGDDLFSNEAANAGGDAAGDNTNVDRVDLLFNTGITVSSQTAFMITDRGNSNQHDDFEIAAITSLDKSGNPASYGPLLEFTTGSWGTTALVPATMEITLRQENPGSTDPLQPSDYVDQTVGGVAVTTAALAANSGATTIYGYSLFATDLTVSGNGSGAQLVNYQNGSVYGAANGTFTGGGLDPTDTPGVLYTATAVPEPTTAALAMTAAGGALLRRRRRTAAGLRGA
jgi:hypothetical protein